MANRAWGIGIGALTIALAGGCVDSLANQAKKDPNSIIGKKTDKIEKFDPKAKQEVSDSKVKADDPILYPLQAYGPMVEQISKMHVEHALDLFNASEGRYPKDYEEFMKRIIKETISSSRFCRATGSMPTTSKIISWKSSGLMAAPRARNRDDRLSSAESSR